ncbi:MAG: protein phosphatase CheZ [Gammaproteobacteria bacterium]
MTEATRLDLANDFLDAIQDGNEEQADEILTMIAAERESRLFEEVGKLTRELHDSLTSVRTESDLANMAENEIPDATERLNFVIEKTEDAANRTMDSVEEILPVSETIRTRSAQLKDDWSRFQRREMDVEEFKKMGDELVDFLEELTTNSDIIHTGLNKILIAQDYQDITGQVIRKVIEVVQQVETSLVGLIRATGVQAGSKKAVSTIEAEGPQINAKKKENVVNGQDEVDDLLSSLGF